MASKLPPVKGSAYTFSTALYAQADNEIKTTPTLAAGDVKVSKDGGATANIASLPSETPASSGIVSVALSSSEMDADEVVVVFKDASGAEWWSQTHVIHTAAQTYDTIDTNVDSVLTDTGSTIPAQITGLNDPTAAAIRAEIDSNSTQLAAIVADTNELQTDLVDGGRLDLLIDAILADTNELQSDWVNGGRLDLLIDAILADTNELQGDWVNGGRLDLLVDAILEDTGTTLPASISGLNNLSAADVNAQLVDVVGTDAIEGTLTQRDILRVLLAFVAGTTTGGNTTSVTFKSQDGNTNRIVMTVDSDGDRSAVTVDGA